MYDVKKSVKEEVRLGKTYVTVNAEGKVDEIAFLTISCSKPHFVPPITSSEVNGEQKFGFDVTSDGFTPLKSVSMQTHDFLTFMKNLTGALVCCSDYFMNPFNFLIKEDYIYVNSSSNDVRIIYLPILESLYSEKDINSQVYEIARTLSRRFSEQSDDWKDVISKMWNMSETATVFEANVIYTSLYNEQREQMERKEVALFKEKEVASVESKYIAPAEVLPVAEPKKKSTGFFGSKKVDKKSDVIEANDDKPAKKGWFGNKNPKPSSPKKGLFGSNNKPKSPKSSIFGGKKKKDINTTPSYEDKTEVLLPEENINTQIAVLHLMEQGTKSSSTPINKDLFLLGRNRHEVDFCFSEEQDKLISRIHAQLTFDGGQHYITDKESKAGTLLNNVKLEPNKPTIIESGSIIKLGQRELMFELY